MAARSSGRSHLESVGARDAAGLLHAEALGSGRRHLASLRQGGSGAARGRGRKKRLGAARDLRSRPERGWPEACIRPASAPMRLTLRPRTVMSYCLTSRTRLRGARSLRGKARADAKSQAARWRWPLVPPHGRCGRSSTAPPRRCADAPRHLPDGEHGVEDAAEAPSGGHGSAVPPGAIGLPSTTALGSAAGLAADLVLLAHTDNQFACEPLTPPPPHTHTHTHTRMGATDNS